MATKKKVPIKVKVKAKPIKANISSCDNRLAKAIAIKIKAKKENNKQYDGF